MDKTVWAIKKGHKIPQKTEMK